MSTSCKRGGFMAPLDSDDNSNNVLEGGKRKLVKKVAAKKPAAKKPAAKKPAAKKPAAKKTK